MNTFTQFLCEFGGADLQILRTCPQLEITKYKNQGFLVLMLVLIANVTSIYSLMLIHTSSLESPLSTLNISDVFTAIFMGLCWTFIVHNSYRLILSSTGYGDGASAIQTKEFLASIPKLLLATSIGLCSGAAITVVALHSEMNHGLSTQQLNLLSSLNDNVDFKYAFTLDTIYQKQADAMDNIRNLQAKQSQYIKNKTHNKEEQLAIADQIKSLKKETEQYIAERKNLYVEINRHKAENEVKIINSIDFLITVDKAMERHLLATLSIFSFTLLIYLAPILIRMIWSKSAYEYLVDFQNYKLLSKYGIAPKAHEIKIGDETFYKDRFTIAEQLLDQVTNQHVMFRKYNTEKQHQYYSRKTAKLNGIEYKEHSNFNESKSSYEQTQQEHYENNTQDAPDSFEARLVSLKDNAPKCFELLEIDEKSTTDEVKAAFQRKIKDYHPDKVNASGSKIKQMAEEETKLVNIAYQTLKKLGFVK